VQDAEVVSGRLPCRERIPPGVAANSNWVLNSPFDDSILPMMETAAFHGLKDDAVLH
jgi:hypothetical protein